MKPLTEQSMEQPLLQPILQPTLQPTLPPESLEQIAFTMQLRPGCADEYRRRHDALWPELADLLRDAGVRDYSIFLEPESGKLFGVLRRPPVHGMKALPEHPVMQCWWRHMADLMETGPDHRPHSADLLPMFHLV